MLATRLRTPGLFLAGALIFAWVGAGFRPFTQPMNAAVAVPAVLVFALSWYRSDFGRVADGAAVRPSRSGLAVWGGLLGALVTWEMAAYVLSPRHDHPTLSSITDTVMSVHLGRAVAFFAWLLVGWVLFVRPKRLPARRRQ